MSDKNFQQRHIGPNALETAEMLKTLGMSSVDELINKTIPAHIRRKQPMNLPAPSSESDL